MFSVEILSVLGFISLNVIFQTIQDKALPDRAEKIPAAIVINEVQLILAEKRTSLAAMRTGIAVFALPLSVVSVLIATSKYYDVIHVMHLLAPLLVICAALVFLGSYLIIRSLIRLHRHDQLILDIKRKHSRIAEFID
jgi:uncharacterized membrane protein YkgB